MASVNENSAQEIASWLDYKKIKESVRETYKAQIETLVQAMEAGEISMDNSTFEITQKLNMPIEGLGITELKYKARLTIGDLRRSSTTIKPADFDGKCVANISAATGKGISHIDKMDTSDFNTGQAIAVFFM